MARWCPLRCASCVRSIFPRTLARLAGLVGLVGALALTGCGEPSVPSTQPRIATLVQTVPTEATAFGAHGVPHTHQVWRDMIAGAAHTLDVASFYVSDTESGASRLTPILDELERAAARGVFVRVLVDASFAKKYPADLERLSASVSVRRVDYAARGGGVHHAKYLVADGRDLYLGSANFDWRALEHIHELGIRIRAPELARALTSVFELDWDRDVQRADGRAWPSVAIAGQRIALVASPKDALPVASAWDLPELVRMIDRAQRSIAVQLLSYDAAYRDGAPWKELHGALLAAAARGVRVRLALSHWQTSHMDAVLELQATKGIDVVLVTVPMHSGGFIPFARVTHAKYMVVDGDVSWIGTSNWKGDYFYASRNVGVVVYGATTARQLGSIFDAVFSGPYATLVDPSGVYTPARVAE